MRRLDRCSTALAAACFLWGLAAASAGADLLTVCASGCDWPTIQAAVNNAAPGDTIQVLSLQPHTEANILVLTSVTIEGVPGFGTVVQAAATPNTQVGRILAVGLNTTVVLRDLTLRYGSVVGDGGGVLNLGHLTLERTNVLTCLAEGGSDAGGGIYNQGTLVLTDSILSGSLATNGGGIYNASNATLTATDSELGDGVGLENGGNLYNLGTATLIRCEVHDGLAGVSGGGIYSEGGSIRFAGFLHDNDAAGTGGGISLHSGSLEVANAMISANDAVAGGSGGGALITGGTAVFRDTTFFANSASFGGALRQASSTALRLENCTLSGNSAKEDGGGLYVDGRRRAEIRSTTVAYNSADSDANGTGNGGGIHLQTCTGTCPTDRVFLANSLVASNVDLSPSGPFAHDCFGLLTSEGYNLIDDASTGAVGSCRVDGDTSGLLIQTAAMFNGTIGDNGGVPATIDGSAPYTCPVRPGSPAIDWGDPAGCTDANGAPLDRDERGAARVGRCDLGAYEANGVPALFLDGFESGDALFWRVH